MVPQLESSWCQGSKNSTAVPTINYAQVLEQGFMTGLQQEEHL